MTSYIKKASGLVTVVDANVVRPGGRQVAPGVIAPVSTANPSPWRPVYPFFCGNPWPWRTRVDGLTQLDPNSASYCAYFKSKNPFPGFATAAGTPVYMVGPDQPTVPVSVTYPGQYQPSTYQVPIPAGAIPSPDQDHLMVVVQETPSAANHQMWEMWATAQNSTTGAWSCGALTPRVHIVTDHPGYSRNVKDAAGHVLEQPIWGCAASRFAYCGGQIQIAEVQEGYIGHAISMSVPWARQGQWSFPAQWTDGTDTNTYAIPYGAWFRLDPTVDLTTLPFGSPFGLLTATALQQFGGIVTDQTGGSVGFAVEIRGSNAGDTSGGAHDVPPYLYEEYFPWKYLQLLPLDMRTTQDMTLYVEQDDTDT